MQIPMAILGQSLLGTLLLTLASPPVRPASPPVRPAPTRSLGPVADRARTLLTPLKIVPVEETLSEAQDDAIEARTLFLQGRMLQQRRQFAPALQRFERAWRFDPQLVSIMDDIVPLAALLNRDGEATRYAVLAAEQQEVPQELLQRVAAILADRLAFDRALRLYRRLLKRQRNKTPNNFAYVLTQYEIGRLALLEGEFKESAAAIKIVRDALQGRGAHSLTEGERRRLLPKPDMAYGLMGESFLHAGLLDDAEAMFRAADKAKPNPGALGYRLAQIEWARGDRDGAMARLQQYFQAKLASASIAPYLLLADMLQYTSKEAAERANPKQRKPSPALLEKLRQLAKADPDNVPLGYFLADKLRRAGQLAEAESLYKKMLKHESTADGYQGLVQIHQQQRRWPMLLQQLGEIAVRVGSFEPLGSTLKELTNDVKLIERLANQTKALLSDSKKEPPEGIAMAIVLLELEAGELDAARRFFPLAMQQPDPGRGRFAINYAFQMLRKRRAKAAAQAFQQVIDEKLFAENIAELYHALAGAWAMDKQTDKALEAARQAVKFAPNSPRMAARTAWVHYFAKQYDKARPEFLRLLDRFDSDDRSEETRLALRDARQILSSICVEQGRTEMAQEWLLQILDEFPEDVGAQNDLGYLWCERGEHLHKSLAMIRKAVHAEPDNEAYRDSLGWVLYQLGRYKEAVAELEKAAQADPIDGVILDHLGDAYQKAGQLPQATEAWENAGKKFQEEKLPDKLKKIRAKLDLHGSNNSNDVDLLGTSLCCLALPAPETNYHRASLDSVTFTDVM